MSKRDAFPVENAFGRTANENHDEAFQLFPKLPLELRLKIWRHTFPHERVICAVYTLWHQLKNGSGVDLIPVALQICRESRMEALKVYQMSSAHVRQNKRLVGENIHQWKHIYMDPTVDIIYFPNDEDGNGAGGSLDCNGVKRFFAHPEIIQRLAIPVSCSWRRHSNYILHIEHFQQFPRLQQLLLVRDDSSIGLVAHSTEIYGEFFDNELVLQDFEDEGTYREIENWYRQMFEKKRKSEGNSCLNVPAVQSAMSIGWRRNSVGNSHTDWVLLPYQKLQEANDVADK
jgi:hypothetical protein